MSENPQICVANISTAERRQRLMGGLATFGFSMVMLAGMAAFGLDPLWRVTLFPLLAGAATGYFQWREKT
jgi:hypothetical protein